MVWEIYFSPNNRYAFIIISVLYVWMNSLLSLLRFFQGWILDIYLVTQTIHLPCSPLNLITIGRSILLGNSVVWLAGLNFCHLFVCWPRWYKLDTFTVVTTTPSAPTKLTNPESLFCSYFHPILVYIRDSHIFFQIKNEYFLECIELLDRQFSLITAFSRAFLYVGNYDISPRFWSRWFSLHSEGNGGNTQDPYGVQLGTLAIKYLTWTTVVWGLIIGERGHVERE